MTTTTDRRLITTVADAAALSHVVPVNPGSLNVVSRVHRDAMLAARAVEANRGGEVPDDAEHEVEDLLANLMHLCDGIGVHFEWALMAARERHEEEAFAANEAGGAWAPHL